MHKKSLILSIPVILAVLILSGWLALRDRGDRKEAEIKENPAKNTEDVQSSSTPEAAIDTSNWKTYRNENTGIEVRIPQEWDALVLGTGIDGDVICFGKKGELYSVVGGEGEVNGCAVMVGPDSWKETKALADIDTKIIPRLRELRNVFTVDHIEVGSQKGILLSYAVGSMEFYVEHRNELYKIDLRPYEYNAGDPVIASRYRNIYLTLLSTLKFLD